MSAESDWQHQYTTNESIAHHRHQNHIITNDFLTHMTFRPKKLMYDSFNNAKVIVEHGCGTGEMIAEIASKAPYTQCYGMDFSEEAIKLALEYKLQVPNVDYRVHDIRSAECPHAGADVCIISNVIEHFENWGQIVDRLVDAYNRVLVIVPYEERIDALPGPAPIDGGGGHCNSFNRNSFMRYRIIEDMVFFSLNGWGVSHAGECPLLYAIMLEKR